jgi:hypothetical protein
MRRKDLVMYFVFVTLSFVNPRLPHAVEAEKQYIPGEILVKFKPGVREAEINALVTSYGASVIKHVAEIDVYRIKIPSGSSVDKMVSIFSSDPRCEYAEPNSIGQGASR